MNADVSSSCRFRDCGRMKLWQEAEEATSSRKLLKSQVEKRRRERMNRSLERLRTLLLQEPGEVGPTPRVEKADILERTVLFLQRRAQQQQQQPHAHSFRAGFSSCLHRASGFLGPDGKRMWLGPALEAAFAARMARSEQATEGGGGGRASLQRSRSLLHALRRKSKDTLGAHATGAPACTPRARESSSEVQQSPAGVQQHHPRVQPPQRLEPAARKPSPARPGPLWRPWP